MRNTLVFAVLSLVATIAIAEEKKKPLSPATTAKATIAGKNITIDYSAPSKRDRKIMGELVPYGKLWRTGANQATTLKTDTDLMIGSLHVPAGEYLLFTIPNEKEWTLVVSKQKGLWGTGGYDEKQDLGRVAMTVTPLKSTTETFTIDLKPASGNKGTLSMAWENTYASVPVMVH
ncbi:MAG TPA: DUF2911 domain-containing protein [Thermoanaerobaculia bacterium]|jgi:hypothetical protein